MSNKKYKIVFEEGVKPSPEDLKLVIESLGDKTWRDFDYQHTSSGRATNGEDILGIFFDSKKSGVSDKAFKAVEDAEYRDLVPENLEKVNELVASNELIEIKFNDILNELKQKKTIKKTAVKKTKKSPTM